VTTLLVAFAFLLLYCIERKIPKELSWHKCDPLTVTVIFYCMPGLDRMQFGIRGRGISGICGNARNIPSAGILVGFGLKRSHKEANNILLQLHQNFNRFNCRLEFCWFAIQYGRPFTCQSVCLCNLSLYLSIYLPVHQARKLGFHGSNHRCASILVLELIITVSRNFILTYKLFVINYSSQSISFWVHYLLHQLINLQLTRHRINYAWHFWNTVRSTVNV
jgi:hypothetical protein